MCLYSIEAHSSCLALGFTLKAPLDCGSIPAVDLPALFQSERVHIFENVRLGLNDCEYTVVYLDIVVISVNARFSESWIGLQACVLLCTAAKFHQLGFVIELSW